MKHYVLFKLKPGVDRNVIYERMTSSFLAIAEELDYFKNPILILNGLDRPNNADIMLQVELDSPDCLQPYLDHPLHVELAKFVKENTISKTPFDIL